MKGVSPVIATVLMVAVAIAAAVVFYSWIMSTTASTTTQASAQAGTIGKYTLRIESAECNADGNYMRFFIRNESDVDINADFTYTITDTSGATVATGVKKDLFIGAHQDKSVTLDDVNALSKEKDKRVTLVLRGPSGIAVSTDQPITCVGK